MAIKVLNWVRICSFKHVPAGVHQVQRPAFIGLLQVNARQTRVIGLFVLNRLLTGEQTPVPNFLFLKKANNKACPKRLIKFLFFWLKTDSVTNCFVVY